jgi:hypothetical protein
VAHTAPRTSFLGDLIYGLVLDGVAGGVFTCVLGCVNELLPAGLAGFHPRW